MNSKPILLFVIDTRPEAIKLAPLIIASRKEVSFDVKVCLTAQHRKILAEVMRRRLNGTNIKLIAALSYSQLIWFMSRCYFILTDSGGIQEEAPSLGKPVLVLRKKTKRNKSILAGIAKLIGTEKKNIIKESTLLLQSTVAYSKMIVDRNPYCDGKKVVLLY